MKRILVLSISLLMLNFSTAGYAEVKVAILNVQKAILSIKEGQDFQTKLRDELANAESVLQQLGDEHNQMAEKLRKEEAFMSQDERQKLIAGIQQKQAQFQQQGQRMQQHKAQREQEFLRTMTPRLETAVSAVQERNKLDLILNRQVVVWSSEALDITPEVVSELEKKPQ